MSLSLAFSSALSGLSLSKRGTQSVADNIANANTEGYGVRSVTQASRSIGSVGNGVAFKGIERQVDHALVTEWRHAASQKEHANVLGSFWQKVETGFGIPGDSGSLSNTVANLDSALQRARLSPDQPAVLQQVTQAALSVANKISGISESLQAERDSADAAINRDIRWLNTTLESIADLNKEIQRQSLLGGAPEGLMDNRQNLIDQVAEKLPVREFPREDGRILLLAKDGTILVDRDAAEFKLSTVSEPPLFTARTEVSINDRLITSDSIMVESGQLGANLQVRDVSVPQVLESLDRFASDLIDRFTEESLATGTSIDPDSNETRVFGLFSMRGQDVFTGYDTENDSGISADIKVNSEILANPALLRAQPAGPTGVSDNFNIDRMVSALQRNSEGSGSVSTMRDVQGHITDIISLIGTERLFVDQEKSLRVGKFTMLNETLASKGVDTDAELSKLLILEQAYSANARVLSTIDAMMRTLMEI